ncbi:MAG: SIMPL domain-containing protein [Proteobacteria bacterium]|nr:SIMPL domain-containing protein [Pseudomonadota bacterium]
MRRLLLAVLLAGAAGCAPEADPRGVARKEVLLQVAATGRSEVRPDEARFTVGVTTQAATAAAASAGDNAAAIRVMAGLERLGVKADNVQTRSVTLSRIDYGPERGRFRADFALR